MSDVITVDPAAVVTIEHMIQENDMLMFTAMSAAMGYLYALFVNGELDNHPKLIRLIKEHRAAFDENKLLIFGDYLN